MRVVMDTTAEQSLSVDENNKVVRIRTGKVYDLTDNRDPLQQARFAIDSIDPTKRVPRHGETHPVVGGLVVKNVDIRHFNNSWRQAEWRATYRGLGGPTNDPILFFLDIIINGVSTMRTTDFDSSGKQAWVYYDTGARVSEDPTNTDTAQLHSQSDMENQYDPIKKPNILREPAQAIVPASATTIEFVFTRMGNPYIAYAQYENTVNEKDFQGDGPGIWRLANIIGTTTQLQGVIPTQPFLWKSHLVFQKSPDARGWSSCNLFIDSRTGRVPRDIDDPGRLDPTKGWAGIEGKNGFAFHKRLRSMDWAGLGMPNLTRV